MKRLLSLVFFISFLLISFIFISPKIKADNSCPPTCIDAGDSCMAQYNQCVGNLSQALQQSQNATHPLQSQLSLMQQQIEGIKARVVQITQDLIDKQTHIDEGYKQIAQKEQILNATIRDFYIKSSYDSPLLIFLSGTTASHITQILAYQKASANQDKAIITNIALSIEDLQQQKQQLESEQANLTALKTSLDDQSAKLNTIVQGALAYQSTLSQQIAVLSSQQQQILAAKLSSLGIPLFAYSTQGGCSSDINPYKDPGFSGTKFGFFTYGVPNRVGLNQYGAKARAESGQSYSQILSAYYNASIGNAGDPTINVTGTNDYGESSWPGGWDLETYLKHIYEMPTSWQMEALKAQAIAARSYVMAYTNNGASSICSDQHCQEVKTEINDSNWQAAVDATRGQVLMSGSQPIKAWFSSTHGGYIHSSGDIGWSSTSFTKNAQDTSGSVNSFTDLQNNAYDKNSPWFYCDWGARISNNKTAWLTSSEVADIANVVTLVQHDSSTKEHLYQQDKSNPAGTDTWDANRVQQELQNRGITPFTSVSNISVSADFGSGKVTKVNVNGDGGTQSFPGDFFKTYFDLRAPANIQIVGPLYNVETR